MLAKPRHELRKKRRLTKIQVRTSFTARPRPFHTDRSACGRETRSRSIRSTATFISSSVSSHLQLPDFAPGKSGSKKKLTRAAIKLPAPSRMNSHCQPAIFRFPSSPAKTPAAMRPEKAVASTSPEYKKAVLNASSFLGYHEDSRNRTPGQYGASAIPKKNRMTKRC